MSTTTLLPTRQLGRTGMHITRVGFGSWAVGGDWTVGWGSQDDREPIAAIRYAVASGVNWIDTAAIYGLGHSEEIVAAALSEITPSERPYVFTKCGLIPNPADRAAAPLEVGAAASLRHEIEESLRRLNVERIDLYRMHWPAEDGTPIEAYWEYAAGPEARRQGSGGWSVESHRRATHGGGGNRSCRYAAATIFRHQARHGGRRITVVPPSWDGRDRLQPDAVRPA